MNAKHELRKLKNAESKYKGSIGSLECKIADCVLFDFTILYQESDGFVMLAFGHYNASLLPLLEIIEKTGRLTKDDYFSHTI